VSTTYDVAVESYKYGHQQGDARRRNTRPTSNISPRVINSFWFDVGDTDGAMGRPERDFRVDATYVGDSTEKQNYDFGFSGSSEPRDESARAWWEAGKRDRAAGTVKLYYVGGSLAPTAGGPRPAPAYVPKPNPNAANLPPVVINAPKPGGGVNQPDVIQRLPPQQPIPPWSWPQGGTGSGSGVVIYGPWGYFDLSRLQPVDRR